MRMNNKKFSDALSYNISDWFILTAALLKIKRHQNVDIVFQTFGLVNNNFSNC